jgi:four helix bundle protein
MHNFRNIDAWKRSRSLVVLVYRITSTFPRAEGHGLISQIRRAVISIGNNIIEGSKRSNKSFANFLTMSEGSAAEAWFMLDLSPELGFATVDAVKPACDELEEIQKMLCALRKTVLRAAGPSRRRSKL